MEQLSETEQQFFVPNNIEDALDIFKSFNDKERVQYLKLTSERLREYKEIFDIFDETGDGNISNEEIGKVMLGLGENAEQERIDELVREIDYDGDGEVDFNEFILLMVKTLTESDQAQEELVEVFQSFDKNGDCEIDY